LIKESNMRYFGRLKNAFAFAAVLILGGALVGCNIEEASKSANTNPEELKPKGNLIITYTDSTTGEPIVGAIIDLGLKTATTNKRGVATFKNIPATTDASGSSTVDGAYSAIVDFSRVTSPINMRDRNATVKYPMSEQKIAITVEYATLEDASTPPDDANINDGSVTNASNHDTPVTGLVGSKNWTVGKLSTSVSGEIRDQKTNALVTEAYIVKLWSGAGQTTLAQSLSTSNGAFSFSKVQAGVTINVTAENVTNTMRGTSGTFTSAEDGRAISLAVGGQVQPILVNERDLAAPWITKVSFSDGTNTFENGADIGTASTVDVMFDFSEAMAANFYNMSTAIVDGSGVVTIGDNIDVRFTGSKADNVAHSLSWNTEMTQLMVTIPNLAASATYEVKILAAASAADRLTDVNDEPLDINLSDGNDGTDIVASFSTSGGATLAAHTDLAMVTANVDSGTGTVTLDWNWQAGAAGYNVYRSTTEGSGSTAFNAGSFDLLVADHNVSNYDDTTVGFITGELPVSYSYVIRAVNSDGVESANSNAVSAADVTNVRLTAVAAFSDADSDGNCETTTLTFGEAVSEAAAEAGTYSYRMGAIQANATKVATSAVLKTLTTVELTFPDDSACADFTDDVDDSEDLTVSGITDLAGNAIDNAGNVWHEDGNTID